MYPHVKEAVERGEVALEGNGSDVKLLKVKAVPGGIPLAVSDAMGNGA